jgi:hypothetical protein
MFQAFKENIPKGQREPSDSVQKNIEKLVKEKFITKKDGCKLKEIRKIRSDHTHLKALRQDRYRLKKDSLNCIKELLIFFNRENILSNYNEYLKKLSIYSSSK